MHVFQLIRVDVAAIIAVVIIIVIICLAVVILTACDEGRRCPITTLLLHLLFIAITVLQG
jgi:hypothetical protein